MPSGIGHFRWGRIALVLGSLYSFIRSPFWVFYWRIRLAAYGARLERVLGSRPRGFKSPILRSSPGLDFLRPGIFLSGAWARQLQEPQLFLVSLCCGSARAAMLVAGQLGGERKRTAVPRHWRNAQRTHSISP